jgi:tetratricopeptide (TPR) repeat protein
MRRLRGIAILCCVPFFLEAQEADSLKVKEIINTVNAIYRVKKDSAIELLTKAEKILQKIKLRSSSSKEKMEMELYDYFSTIYQENGKLEEAKKYYELLLERAIQRKDTENIAGVYYGLGMLMQQQGNIPKSTEYHSKALEIYESKNERGKTALELYCLAQLYGQQKDSIKEVEYYSKSLKIYESMNDNWGIALLQASFGYLYLSHNNYNLALKFFRRNLDIYSASQMPDGSLGDPWGLGNSLEGIGKVYAKMDKIDSALSNFSRALAIRQKTGYRPGQVNTLIAMADLFYRSNDSKKAERYAKNGLSLARETGSAQGIRSASWLLYKVYKKNGNFPAAYDMFNVSVQMRDSILNEKNRKTVLQQQLSYEFEKKAAVDEADQKSRETIAMDEKHKQQLIIYSVGALLLLVFILAAIVWMGSRQKQKANVEISAQKRVIEEKQKEIVDSIHYAKRIQVSLMANEKYIYQNLARLKK